MSESREWRRSAVESFGCPYRYDKLNNEGVDDTGDEAIRGRAFHAAAWTYILRLATAKVESDAEEARASFAAGVAVTGCPDHLVPQVQRLFFRWAERFELDVEAFLAAEVIEKVKHRRLQPDLVYCRPGELEIIDFKTYYKGLTETQAREELQLRWYLVAAMEKWPGFPQYRFTFEFVRLNYSVSLTFTPEEIQQFEPGIEAATAAIERAEETGEYPALPGSHCSLCRLKCPKVDNEFRMPIRIMSVVDRDEVADQIVASEQKMKQLKKLLRAHCEIEGGFVRNGQVFAFFDTRSRVYPADHVLGFCHQRNIDTGEVVLSASGLGKLANPKKGPIDLLAELNEVKIESQQWTFRHKKHGEDAPDDVVDVLGDYEDEGIEE